MKRTNLLLSLSLLSVSAFGAVCPSGGTLQDYINLSISDGGCDAGPDFIMSNWAYVNVSVFATPVTASDIIVSYSFNGSGEPQIDFAASWLADVNLLTSTGVGIIGFSLEARSATYNFSSVDLVATGSVSPLYQGLVPTANANVVEVNCIGGLADLRDPNNLLIITPPVNLGDIACNGGSAQAGATVALAPGTGVSANATINLGPGDNFIDVIKIVSVLDMLNVGVLGIDGRAEITNISQAFSGADTSGVPEPGAFILTGLGLAAVGFARRRRGAGRN